MYELTLVKFDGESIQLEIDFDEWPDVDLENDVHIEAILTSIRSALDDIAEAAYA